MDWSTACPDWEERILSGRSLVPDLPLFADEAARALRVFKRLRLPDVIGQPTMAEACGEWFFPIVEAIFGSYDTQNNVRKIQEIFQLIPKGNSKSSNGGAVMVTALIVNRRPEAEFLLIAPTKEIADIAFKQASGTIRIDPELSKIFHIQRHIRLITHRRSGATLQIKAADTDVITGSKATGTMIDETHVFAKKAGAADVFVELRGALTKRPDGFLFQTTTQSKAPPSGVFKTELNMARAVRDGRMRLPLLPILYELPDRIAKDGGWKTRKYWPLVNPNLGRSTSEQFLANEVMKAEAEGESQLSLIASQHFNVELGLSMNMDRWPGADYWLDAADTSLTLEEILSRSEVCVAGIDGGGLDDLFGLAVLGRDRETRDWMLWTRAWAHSDVLNRRKEIAPTLRDFEADGDLVISEDPVQPIRDAADIVEKIKLSGLLPEKAGVGLDPYGVGALVDELAEREIQGEVLAAVRQGSALSPATWGTEIKLKNKTLRHSGSKLMNWCVGNAKTEVRGGAVLITKQSSGRAKIDPLVAAFNAVMLMSRNPEAKRAPEHQMFFV